MAIKITHFPTVRDLEDFDFAALPSIDKNQIRDLAACRWLAHGAALLLLGPPGVGKTHLAIALGREAIRRRYSVLFVAAPALVAGLVKVHADGRLEERLGFYARPKLLIVNEPGDLPFETNAVHLFFQRVSRRYERGSMLVTSNRSVGEWSSVFGDPVVATAILNRLLLHHSQVITIGGDSYRLREKRRAGLVRATSSPRSRGREPGLPGPQAAPARPTACRAEGAVRRAGPSPVTAHSTPGVSFFVSPGVRPSGWTGWD